MGKWMSYKKNSFAIRHLPFVILFFLPNASFAQLTHVNRMLVSLMPMVPTIDGNPAFLTGDSSLTPLFAATQKSKTSAAPMFYVAQLSANVQRADSGKARMDINMQGELLQPHEFRCDTSHARATVDLNLTANDWNALQNNSDRYVHYGTPPGGFWSDTLEPILVVLGAAAVVALFFLIRS